MLPLLIWGLIMANQYSEMLSQTFEHEGGLNLNEYGGGGISNFGVTQTIYDAYRKRKSLPKQSVKEITLAEKQDVYYTIFYTEPKIDTLPGSVRNEVFDFGTNSSPKTAIEMLQSIVGAEVDGKIGPQTLGAVNAYSNVHGEEALAVELLDTRQEYLNDVIEADETQRVHAQGWTNRINDRKGKYLGNTNAGLTSALGAGGDR